MFGAPDSDTQVEQTEKSIAALLKISNNEQDMEEEEDNVIFAISQEWESKSLEGVGSYCYRNTQRCGSGGLGHRTTVLLSNSM